MEGALASANDSGKSGAEAVAFALFGEDTWSYDGAILPFNSQKILGELPACRGLDDWISKKGQCISRRVMKPVHNAYKGLRAEFRISVENNSSKLLREGEETSTAVNRLTQSFITNRLQSVEDRSISTIHLSYEIWFWFALWGYLLISIAVAKIWFYFFARYLHSSNGGNIPIRLSYEPSKECDCDRRIGTYDPDINGSAGVDGDAAAYSSNAERIVLEDSRLRLSCDVSTWYCFDSKDITWGPKVGRKIFFVSMRPTYGAGGQVRPLRVSFKTIYPINP